MFQFGRFPCRSLGMAALEHHRVSPFGHLRLLRSYTPYRSFSQYNTSFFGMRCLGIHCVPLVAFRTIVRSLRLSWHATFRYYLRIDYSTVKTHCSQTASAARLQILPATIKHVKNQSDGFHKLTASADNTSFTIPKPVSSLARQFTCG